MRKVKLAVIVFALLIAVPGAFAQNKTGLIDSLLTSLHEKEDFDGKVLISEKGKILYQKSFGYAVKEYGNILTGETVFSLASVSKMFTGIAIMKLVEQGKLKLSDDLQVYFTDLSYEHITIYNLLTHTSGLEEYFAPAVRNTLGPGPTNSDIEKAYARANLKAKFPAGTNWSYCNTNFMLLALIIEKASGISYPEYLKHYIFEPAGMKHSFVLAKNAPERLGKQIAAIYNYADFVAVRPVNVDSIPPARKYYSIIKNSYGDGSVFSTAGDLFLFHKALERGKILSKRDLQTVYTPVNLPGGKTYEAGNANADYSSGYGLGCQVAKDSSSGKIIWHTGSNPGTLIFFMRNITRNQCVIILNNNWYRGTFHLGGSIMNILDGRPIQLLPPSLARKIGQEYTLHGREASLRLLATLKNGKEYHIGLLEMNELGYNLLAKNDTEAAIEVFKVNTQAYPTNGDIWDSLAEAYYKAGNLDEASRDYEKSVSLNPGNENGKQMLKKIKEEMLKGNK